MSEVYDQLNELIPEFNEIQDEQLREKTIAAWVDGLQRGGWTPQQLTKFPFSLLIEGLEISFLEHIRATAKMSASIHDTLKEHYGDKLSLNRDYLIAGALLADVGKLMEYQPDDVKGARKAEHGNYLRHPFSSVGLGWVQGLPDEVLHIAAVHSKEGKEFRRSPEAIIFHHADFVDFQIFGGGY
ncbi:HD domain-containing protein [bacterium]|nr:HD domain-containing protein [bacterium]